MIILLLLIMILVFIEIWKEVHEFTITEYKIITDKLKKEEKPLKIAFLSDMHNHVYGADNEELIAAIKRGKPDYILIGGDMLVGRKQKYEYKEAVEFVKKLPEIAPVYYANGNHEERMHLIPENYGDSYYEYKSLLESAGIMWLENEAVKLPWNKNEIVVYGVELPLDCYRKKEKYWLQLSDLTEQIGNPEKDKYNILLAHHPSFAKVYKNWGADLILSGHLHGGVARLPVFGGVGVISPQFGLFPKYSGDCYDLDGTKLVVSRGLGTHTIHVRFWNSAELIFLEIQGER